MANEKNLSTKVVTDEVRMSHVKINKPNEDGKYSMAVLIAKSSTEQLKRIKAAIDAVKTDPASEKKWGKKWNAEMKAPLRDGDLKADKYPECEGHYFFNCNSTQKPGVVDANRNPIIDASEIYSGMYGRVSVTFYAYNKDGGIGIAASLNNVQKLRDGEPLAGSRSTPEEDFGAPADGGFLD